jgi:dihydroorotate dehydrogenase
MNLSTRYLGMILRTPLVPSASPLSDSLDNVKRMEDAGAAAIVFHSLFEEHIVKERHELYQHLIHGTESYAEALTYAPNLNELTVDLETLCVTPNILLSTPMAMRLTLRWIAILRGRVDVDLAATSGIHSAKDAIKMVMAGADVTMLCSVLLRCGIDHIKVIESEMKDWLVAHEYDSLEQLKGSMSQKNCPDSDAFERAQYVRGLSTSWQTISDR